MRTRPGPGSGPCSPPTHPRWWPLPVPELSNALLGALVEAALYVSRADDQAAATESMRAAFEALLAGLRTGD